MTGIKPIDVYVSLADTTNPPRENKTVNEYGFSYIRVKGLAVHAAMESACELARHHVPGYYDDGEIRRAIVSSFYRSFGTTGIDNPLVQSVDVSISFTHVENMTAQKRVNEMLAVADDFVRGYLESIWFTNGEEIPVHSDDDDDSQDNQDFWPLEFDPENISAGSLQSIVDDCAAFKAVNPELFELAASVRPESHLGHDFWLTRNGHGTGFWDREEINQTFTLSTEHDSIEILSSDTISQKLTEYSKPFGECNPWNDGDKCHI